MEDQQNKYSFDVDKVQEKLSNLKTLEDLTGPNGAIQELVKGTIERILKAEQEAHLGYAPNAKEGYNSGNSRNGYSSKKVRTSSGEMEIKVPRDREGSFAPEFIKKNQSFDKDLEKRVLSLYSRGLSVRDISSELKEFYGTEVSPALISAITDSLLDAAKTWQARPLRSVYPVVYLDAIHYKIRQDGKVISKACYTIMGIDLDGDVDVLGLWIAEKEGAHFWQKVLSDLKARGVEDILIACIDGLKGFPEAIANTFPKTSIQLCVVHQIRTSLRYLSSKYHKEFLKDLKSVYQADNLESAEFALTELKDKWHSRAQASVDTWVNNWDRLTTYFEFPNEVRKIIYTTNAVEALHRQFRKITKTKSSFPTDDSLLKILYAAIGNMKNTLKRKKEWRTMIGQLKVVFEDRIPEESV